MSAIVHRQFVGMNADANPDEVRDGEVKDAKNIVFRRPGVAEPRNGLITGDDDQLSAVVNVQQMVPYDGGVVLLDDEAVIAPDGDTSATTVTDPDSDPLECHDGFCGAAQVRGNLYIGTAKGVQKITAIDDSSAEFAGVGANGASVTNYSLADSENWLEDGFVVGYRTVIRRKDSNGVITRSRPSVALWVINDSGNDRSPTLQMYDSDSNALSTDTIEVYRTISVSGTVAPDAYYFAFEYALSSGGSDREVLDDLPEDELGAALYADNEPASGKPYSGKCFALYAGSLFVGNCTGPYTKILALKGGVNPSRSGILVGITATEGSNEVELGLETSNPLDADVVVGQHAHSVTGLFPAGAFVTAVDGTTVTLSEVAGTPGGVESLWFYERINISNGEDDVSISMRDLGTERIVLGAEFISIKGFDAKELTDPIGYEGGDIIREVQPGRYAGPYSIRATNGATSFQQPIAEWGEARTEFDRDEEPALLQWSLLDKPEMFTPGIGQAWVGNQKKAILALVNTSDRLFIFKEDGVFVLEGATERSGFRLDRLSDHVLMTPRHACATEIGVAAWTDAGVVIISDSGSVANISATRIDTYLSRYPKPSTDPAVISGNMFYDEAHNELHLMAENGADDSDHPELDAPMHLVWNAQTNAWSRWELQSPAVVGCSPGHQSARHSFLTNTDGAARVWRSVVASEQSVLERAYCDMHYDEDTFSTTLFRPDSSSTVYFDKAFTDEALPAVGDFVFFNDPAKWRVTQVATISGTTRRVYADSGDSPPLGAGGSGLFALRLFRSYECELRLHPQAGQKSVEWKHWLQARWKLQGRTGLYQATLGALSTDSLTEDTEDVAGGTMAIHEDGRAGYPPWSPRYMFPRDHASAQAVEPFFRVREAGSVWALSGCAIEHEDGSLEVSR